MRFDTRTIGVFEVLSVQLVAGEVFDAGRLRQETLRLVEKGSRRIVVDLSGVDYLYSDSINAIVALNRRMLESSGRMGILVPHPKVYDILVRAGLENIMRLYRSEAELLSDSRELMRQSSAWTRPAELLSAASASQVLSANVLAPKSPSDQRDAASASQRIPRRRVGSRVELKPRRRGGRSLDQEPPTGDFQLPPILPALPGESTTLQNLSQDSSAFDQQAAFQKSSKAGKAPKQPVSPRPEPPQPAAEPPVFNVPDNTQHDGYSTNAWLLSLTSPAQAAPPTQKPIAAKTVAGSSSFLPKIPPTVRQNLQDAQPKFVTEFAWDESKVSPTETPHPEAHTAPPLAPLPQPAPAAPPKTASPFLEGPHFSAYLSDPAPGHTVDPTNSVGASSPPKSWAPPVEWITPSDIRHSPAPQDAPPPTPPNAVAPEAITPKAHSASPENWLSETPVKPKTATGSHHVPPAPKSAPAKSGANLEAWFGAGTATPATNPVKPHPRSTTQHASSSASALDWVTPSPSTEPARHKKVDTVSPPPVVNSSITAPAAPTAPIFKPAPAYTPKTVPVGGTAWMETTKSRSKPVVVTPKEPTSFLDTDDLNGKQSSKKPLVFALAGLAVVAVVSLGIFFQSGSKKNATDTSLKTTQAESTSVAPVAAQPASEAIKPAVTEAKVESEAPKPESKSKDKSKKSKDKLKKPKDKSDSKNKHKTSTDKAHASAQEAAKPAPVPEEVHAPVKIFVTSRPSGAAVTLDGSRMGTTPCEITFKRTGKLEFNLAGYRKQSKDIDPDETRGTVNVQLSSDGGNSGIGHIFINSAPQGAEIVVGGNVVGKTPKLIDLPTGSQKVTVRSGVLTKTKTLDIQSGTNTAEHFSL